MLKLFKPDFDNFEGVRPINVYVMRVFFALMFVMVSSDAWSRIVSHQGPWQPTDAVAWCVWAAYSTLSVLGIYNTLKLLPIMLFMLLYKSIWLLAVAYPLWQSDRLVVGSPTEQMAGMFILIVIPALFFPWRYFFWHFVVPTRPARPQH